MSELYDWAKEHDDLQEEDLRTDWRSIGLYALGCYCVACTVMFTDAWANGYWG